MLPSLVSRSIDAVSNYFLSPDFTHFLRDFSHRRIFLLNSLSVWSSNFLLEQICVLAFWVVCRCLCLSATSIVFVRRLTDRLFFSLYLPNSTLAAGGGELAAACSAVPNIPSSRVPARARHSFSPLFCKWERERRERAITASFPDPAALLSKNA